MNRPSENDYVDIHNHGGSAKSGVFVVNTLMAHEGLKPENIPGLAFTTGIHPWFLNRDEAEHLKEYVTKYSGHPSVIAMGEAGFDRLRGPDPDLQTDIFFFQAGLAEHLQKPLVIHCVKGWEELFFSYRALKPSMPWLIHGFRGNKILAGQLLDKGFYLSIWYDFALRVESSALLSYIPSDRLFLETDGSGTDIRILYSKAAADKKQNINDFKRDILRSFDTVFKIRQKNET